MTASSDDPPREYNLPLVVGSLIAGVFFGGVGGGVAFPTLPTLGAILGISPFLVGVILSTNRFTRLVMNTPAGQIIDTVGPRKPMIIGLVLQGVAPFGYIVGLYPSFVPLLDAAAIFILARIVWGIGSAFVFVGAYSIVIHVTSDDNRGKWIGYFRGGQALGFPSGLILGGVLSDLYGFEVAFGSAGAAGLFAAVVAALALPTVHNVAHDPVRIRDLPRLVRSDSRILMIGSVNFTIRFLFSGILLSTVVLYLEANDISIGVFSEVGASGFIMAVTVLASSATTVVSGNLSDYVGDRALVTVPALALFAFGFALLGFVPTLSMTIVGVVCIGIGVGGTNPPLLAYLGDISPEADVGKMGGIYNVFGDLGAAVGPVIAVPLGAAVGYRMEYLLCAGMALGCLLFVVVTLLGVEPDVEPEQAPSEERTDI
ncbi:MFS transporter [Salinadaptatus halalkaliphilus]|uniref:MFS transporter n=1 Tax=Salinadaptatus halalkaliphilus TaxID=2419781 RepID=A0A4S3TR01_9EURY|nr:MFS transporter [Salinadaptatus halalkaliphilus]THE66839.1 MFS transporter [Salinadaptatus halalkaliphilus]